MSVAHFAAEELANAAAYLISSRYSGPEHMEQVLTDLATWSKGNTWAFNAQYGAGQSQAYTAACIKVELRPLVRSFNRERAKSTIRLLAYNGVTNSGAEAKVKGYQAALARLLGDAFARVLDEQELAAA